jgi:putative aldouronate transport system permease protein
LAAYALSRKDLVGRKWIMLFFTFTMFFGGGLIPSYLNIKSLGLLNSRFYIIIHGAVSVYNMIVMRTYFMSNIPDELYDAASVDGCRNTRFFFQIVLPLSKAIIAVMITFFAVGKWNSYFTEMIYLTNRNYFPLQLFLREILTSVRELLQATDQSFVDEIAANESLIFAETVKYGIIIISSVPMLIIYPFAQKYFVQGVMIGSLKG